MFVYTRTTVYLIPTAASLESVLIFAEATCRNILSAEKSRKTGRLPPKKWALLYLDLFKTPQNTKNNKRS